ncbi:MAG TPA: dihydropteroate synthase [Candidatus Paceibacterota bacterium]|nr:dihydropteroate synthase [Verrucomicrobiota bacterium]HOX04015.1 dihydropteroate synthase [Verrucomicrobiota bacterium]HRZ46909.1 dihydropteroate synthase [Candidatus Paceibacterota bacterium]HRZ92143.1 dihydropteroate synthase [Candidatus Paceibacterota bacterium]
MLALEDLARIAADYQQTAPLQVREFSLGGRRFPFNTRPAIMGAINLSSDSWYRESVCLSAEQAIRRGRVLAAQGADLVDLGAESTLAHAARADESAQQRRIEPVVSALRALDILVSVETYQPAVARAALEAGANVINLTGVDHIDAIFDLAAARQAAVIVCYVQGPHVRQVGDLEFDADPIDAMGDFFSRQIELARRKGLERIFLDPGLGFYYRNLRDSAQRIRFQMRTFLHTFRLRALGFPICHALPHAFECFGEEVRCAEPFFAVLAALGKTDLFRTHEVSRVRAVLETLRLWPSPSSGESDPPRTPGI